MLELLREQEEERRLAAVPLADSLIRACASASDGGHRAMERAQATAYEALRCGKADSGNHNSSSEHRVGSDSRLENAVFEKGVKRFVAGQRQGGPVAWNGGSKNQENELLFFDDENNHNTGSINNIVDVDGYGSGGVVDQHRPRQQLRPRSKADVRREDLLSAASRATRHHMEPEWAAVELLECIDDELNPDRGPKQQQEHSSQMMSAIRVLPAPVAGDLFVTCAARGNIGVILYYYAEGLPIDHSHTTLKYQALHAAVEFGHLDSARLLVTMGAKVDARGGTDDRSPLFLAALAKRWDACAWLLEVGASKNLRDKKGLTAYQAMAGSSDPEVAGRSGMLTDPPQRVVSVACKGITRNSLHLTWSEPLRSYDEEVFVGYLVEWRPMRPRPVCVAHSRHVAERVRPPRTGKKKRGRAAWKGAETRPETAGESTNMHDMRAPLLLSISGALRAEGLLNQRPNTRGGETNVDADGCPAQALPWETREVESNVLKLKRLHPATNYMVRVSARTLAGYGVPSREALLRTRMAPPSAPMEAANMVSATPNSITVGWVPPKFENGAPITRYEIQRLVLDQNHPDWDKGRESITTGGDESLTTTTRDDSSTSCSGSSSGSGSSSSSGSSKSDAGETVSATTITGSNGCSSSSKEKKKKKTPNADADEVSFPSVLGGESGPGSGSTGGDRKQVGVWIGQRTDKMLPYSTAAGLPTYCRALFRVRAENSAGWGRWSPSSDALEAQDIILPVKRGATHMLMRWFNKPEGDVLKWELSRRVFRYGTDFRGDDDDTWLVCSRDIPGLRGGESTFRCKGLMPGTEYQFRLRSYSNGAWQAKEESIVSSPFKTICSPPDAPPECPQTRQLAADPLVPGGLTDAGALLSAETVGRVDRTRDTRGDGGGGGGGGGGVKNDVTVGIGENAVISSAGQGAVAAAAAAVFRGKPQAEAEEGDVGSLRECRRGYNDSFDDDNDDVKQNSIATSSAAEVDIAGTCNNDNNKNSNRGKGAGVAAGSGSDNRKRTSSDQGRNRQRGCQEAGGEEEDKDRAGRELMDVRREWLLSDDEPEAPRQILMLPALRNAPMEREDEACEKGRVEQGETKGDERFAAEATESDSKGSTTIVLDWISGCTNGAITTNYEVWGLADLTRSQSSGSGEWTFVALTEAAPTATLSGLREAQPYRFKVRARNALGWSEFSPPTPPLNLNPLRPCDPPELVDRGVTWLALRLRPPPKAGLVLGFEVQMCRWTPGMSEGDESWSLMVDSQQGKRGENGAKGFLRSSTAPAPGPTTASSTREESRMVWDLRPGAGYRFKARARTVFGWSPVGTATAVYSTTRRF
ncbi:unnamed protein product [Pylaiella littoralis]